MRLEPTKIRTHTIVQDGAIDHLIEGVVVHPLRLFPDDRGHFAEVFRHDDPIAAGFTFRQTSTTRSQPGVIKAFHYHKKQDDIFLPVAGKARIALVDFRVESPTYGVAHSIFAGELYPRAVRIPAGVAHGYEVMPGDDLVMVYYTNATYDPADEFRLSHDDPAVGFDAWGITNR